ncbi:hypothetical protein EJP77_13945 [Paenibacillus zeisoli]|uniref:Uncharacterized protein n=1 Tax=Paenibacillus zeisoli TaxID=2496267 RepID=A0A3S1DWD9_9BACL|nr:DUF6157 family protein [Paenibacillus zeisoli]RUT29909.1 hypothetical protein EJP77_13945 [Paenibacillus zeisoli]
MSYTNTFIIVSADCPVITSTVPVSSRAKKTAYEIEFDLLSRNPYRYNEKELIYEIHIRHKDLDASYVTSHADEIWEELFRKPHPCLRASQLPKKFGWGIHYNEEGRIALYGIDSDEYQAFLEPGEGKPTLVPAMRSRRST